MRKIHDEFTDLPVSRQRKKQLRNVKNGLCPICGQPKVTKVLPHQFTQEISATACVFEISAVFRPFDDNTDPWEDESDCPIDLS